MAAAGCGYREGALPARQMALLILDSLKDKLEHYNEVTEAMRYLTTDTFTDEAEERAFLAKFSPEEIADFDRQILEQCREMGAAREASRIEAAHPQTFGPIIDGILDTVRPK